MSVLTRAENFYLNILRVLILTVATLALIAAVIGGINGLMLLRPASSDGTKPPPGLESATLGDFVAEKKAEGAPVGTVNTDSTGASTTTTTETVISSPTVKQAAENLRTYVRRNMAFDLTITSAIKEIQANEAGVPDAYHAAYEESLLALTHQLVIAKGRALTAENVDQLLTWHAAKFKAAADEETAREAAKKVAQMGALQLGGYALVTFILLVFAFIFVKIERNLRAVAVAAELRA